MKDKTKSQNEAAFYQTIDKAARIYEKSGNIHGFVIKRNLANGSVSLGVSNDGENGMHATKALTEKETGGKARNYK